ncbi:Farnesol kinase, chloroplastic [Vitis vinifera]|uniref:Farnesol kinase, chloroplastic n=1 Tax=Vitis vinifera TaxID=29760 RepID=A0A438G1W3_VITVI|nr:Farnesol kinase, chloroplastic [Vitis vinifera]
MLVLATRSIDCNGQQQRLNSTASAAVAYSTADFRLAGRPPLKVTFSAGVTATTGFRNPVAGDICAAALTGGTVLSLIQFWGGIAKRGFTGQTVSRKLVHISVGLVFMLFWPLFSSGCRGALLAALIPGVNIIRMLLLGLGIWKDEAVVKSMSRYGDHRLQFWKKSYFRILFHASGNFSRDHYAMPQLLLLPVQSIGELPHCNCCNLQLVCWRWYSPQEDLTYNTNEKKGRPCLELSCLADLVGRRFGIQKIPYNRNKSFSGSLAMAVAGTCIILPHLGLSRKLGNGFRLLGCFSWLNIVESLPISNEIDDNLTIPVTSLLLGTLVF